MNVSRSASQAAGSFCRRSGRILSVTRLRGQVIAAFISIMALCSAATPQTNVRISGHVRDAFDGHPVPRAVVRIQNTDYLTVADGLGGFFFEHLPDGRYRVEVTADGYEPSTGENVDVSEDVTRPVVILLRRKVHDLGVREVRGQTGVVPTADVVVVDRRDIGKTGAAGIGDVLDRIAGVYIQETGPSGGTAQVSIRGSAPRHVLVLVDGQRINPSGSGEADLSTIPLEMVEKIEVYRNGESARFGADALGGAINIVTMGAKTAVESEVVCDNYWGKWKTNSRAVTFLGPVRVSRLVTKLAYSEKTTNGDFPYTYAVDTRAKSYTGVRRNNDSRRDNYFVSATYRPDGATSIGFSGQIYRSRQGLPGSVSDIDTTAWKRDARMMGNLMVERDVSSSLLLESTLGLSRFEQYFDNADHPLVAERYETRFTNDAARTQVSGRYQVTKANTLRCGLEWQRDILYHDDLYRPAFSMGRVVRDDIGLFVSDQHMFDLSRLQVWDAAVVDLSLRFDHAAGKHDATSPGDSSSTHQAAYWSKKAGVSLSRGSKERVTVRASYGNSFQLPSVNALFWKGDVRAGGNPELRPEIAEHSDVGAEVIIDRAVKISAGITYFHSYVKDLIVWQPAYQDVWKPVNLEAAQISGHEDFVRIDLWHERVGLSYQNTVTVPRNRAVGANSYNKRLTYRPHYVTTVEAAVQYGIFKGEYTIRLVDIRYATEANTKWYDAYRVDNLQLGIKADVLSFTVDAGYRAKNLRGEDYVLVGHYPMPGREWGVDFSLTFRM